MRSWPKLAMERSLKRSEGQPSVTEAQLRASPKEAAHTLAWHVPQPDGKLMYINWHDNEVTHEVTHVSVKFALKVADRTSINMNQLLRLESTE